MRVCPSCGSILQMFAALLPFANPLIDSNVHSSTSVRTNTNAQRVQLSRIKVFQCFICKKQLAIDLIRPVLCTGTCKYYYFTNTNDSIKLTPSSYTSQLNRIRYTRYDSSRYPIICDVRRTTAD